MDNQLATLIDDRKALERDKSYYTAIRSLADDSQFKRIRSVKKARAEDLITALKKISPESMLDIARIQAKLQVHEAEVREMEEFNQIIEELDRKLSIANDAIKKLTK